MHHSIHTLGTSRFNASRGLQPPKDLALTPATDLKANCSARYVLGRRQHCPLRARCFTASVGLLTVLSRLRPRAMVTAGPVDSS